MLKKKSAQQFGPYYVSKDSKKLWLMCKEHSHKSSTDTYNLKLIVFQAWSKTEEK